ncbi:MAG: four helix bundle protein [Opitutae bacterium]|nr:four helix bundle protein [Opitutae bacterium]
MSAPIFDHEKLKAYQEALRFIGWITPIIDRLPGRVAAKDQLDRASTSIALNLAEGNGKRSHPDRCRFFDIARGSGVECAACLDVLRVKQLVSDDEVTIGKSILIEVVSMTAGLIARFGGAVHEDAANYLSNEEIEEKEKD